MRTIAKTTLALCFVGAMAIGTTAPVKAQGYLDQRYTQRAYRATMSMAPCTGIIQTGAITPMLPTEECDMERLPAESHHPGRL